MIIDKYNTFSSLQDISNGAVAGTSVEKVSDIIDLAAARGMGSGDPLSVNVILSTALTGSGVTHLRIEVLADNDTPSGPTALASAFVLTKHPVDIPVADCTVGSSFDIPIPRSPIKTNQSDSTYHYRYLQVRYTIIGTNPFTPAGAVTAVLTCDDQDRRSYPVGFTMVG